MENKEKIYKKVIGKPGAQKNLPLHVNSTGEYLRKDLVLMAMDEYAKEFIQTLTEISHWGEINGDFKAHAKRALKSV